MQDIFKKLIKNENLKKGIASDSCVLFFIKNCKTLETLNFNPLHFVLQSRGNICALIFIRIMLARPR